jgi:hypothetical protein
MTPGHALRFVAQHGGEHKSAAALLAEATEHEQAALRCDRVLLANAGRKGNRRRARDLHRARESEVHRANAKVATLAAVEVKKRKVATVGEALKPAPIRWLRQLCGRMDAPVAE